MNSEPGEPQEEISAPSRKVRLAWWLGIYFTGFLVALGSMWQPGMFSRFWLGCLFTFFFYAPVGLFQVFTYMAGDPSNEILITLLVLLGLAFYPIHLIVTLVFHSPWKFQCLMIILIAALVISWIGDIKVDGWRLTRSGGFHQLSPEQIERLKNSPAQK